jgi:hypothetical protein
MNESIRTGIRKGEQKTLGFVKTDMLRENEDRQSRKEQYAINQKMR